MSNDFKKVLVKDDRIAGITDQITYSINKGGQNMTASQFQAISQSTSSHTYNIQVPSEQTLIDRRVLWQSTVILQINYASLPANTQVVNYGYTDALAPFPLHSLCTVMTATINNNSVSINIKDVLASLLRFNDRRELQRYNGYTPVAYDTYANYTDGVGSNNNALGSWNITSDNDLNPRGSWLLETWGNDAFGNPFFVSTSPTAPSAFVPVNAVSSGSVYIKFKVTEPLLLSPFIFCNPHTNNQAFYGIQNCNFVFNIGDGNRCWRTANSWITGCQPFSFTSSQLLFNFLTTHPSDMLPSRNCVPFYEMPRYLTTSLPNFGAYGSGTDTQIVRSQTLQLNQIPDKLIVCVRKAMGDQKPQDTDSFLSIKGISINFNNQSGILASSTVNDLYRYSVENGSNQSFYEFNGSANKSNATGSVRVATSGSLLVLEFGKDIQLVEDFYCSGSLGNFNLQIQLSVQNQYNVAINDAELMIITMNSGVFCCEKGTSSTYTGLLTKQDVLDVSSQEAYGKSDVQRLVGGGFLDTLKSIGSKLLPKLPSLAKAGLSLIPHPAAQMASQGIGAMGYGRSGGGASGGGMSGGRMHSKMAEHLA
jgi:hypothetical protein